VSFGGWEMLYVYVSVYSGFGRDYYGDQLMHVEHCILVEVTIVWKAQHNAQTLTFFFSTFSLPL